MQIKKKSKLAKFELKVIKCGTCIYVIMFLKIVIKAFFKDNIITRLDFGDL